MDSQKVIRISLLFTRNILSVFFLFFQFHVVSAQEIRIGLEIPGASESAFYQALGEETWILNGDDSQLLIDRLQARDQVEMIASGGKVVLRKNGTEITRGGKFIFWSNDTEPRFNIIPKKKSDASYLYPDHLEVSARGARLVLVNKTEIENYLPGVVEAEAGIYQSIEFLKVQSVSTRTYALANLGKHSYVGFDLCDKVHCQVFRGMKDVSQMVFKAVQATHSEVIIFGESELVDAVFCANCGGCTANSEDVWNGARPYLRAVTDSNFCSASPNHLWEKQVTKTAFLEKLSKASKKKIETYDVFPDVSGRVKEIRLNGSQTLSLSGEELRKIFGLKSSMFNILECDSVFKFVGAGHGHGVGLCQDGAFHLSESGMKYDEIISHYYQGVRVVKPKGKLTIDN